MGSGCNPTTTYSSAITISSTNTLRYYSIDAAGNVEIVKQEVYTINIDSQAPSVPAGLTATAVSSSQINLSWTASTDNVGVTGYNVFRNGTKIASPTVTSYQDSGLSSSTTYNYKVSAFDAASNESAQSVQASVTTLAGCFDLTSDGKVDVFDLVFVALRLGNPAGDPADVLSNDGVNLQDLQEVAKQFGRKC
ncbi:fibronectin type III domain-containing protein [archaeon]|nr:fibronectin type III domain-containing protein [archaeon]